jgi:hypothetical protein
MAGNNNFLHSFAGVDGDGYGYEGYGYEGFGETLFGLPLGVLMRTLNDPTTASPRERGEIKMK